MVEARLADAFSRPLARVGRRPRARPSEAALASLLPHISAADPADYQPANITFALLPPLDDAAKQKFRRDKRARHAEVCRRAIESMDQFLNEYARV